MTAIYTHTRIETIREQLSQAMARREAIAVANDWLARLDDLPDLVHRLGA